MFATLRLPALRWALPGALVLLLLSGPAWTQAQPELPLERIEIVARSGVHVFDVEMALTADQRMTGLMFRKELPPGRGMLFDFEEERHVGMWMRNTYVSLDMLFIRADGRVARIAESTEPLSLATIASGVPVRAVLEVVAGTAKKLGLAPGDRVAHRLFRKR